MPSRNTLHARNRGYSDIKQLERGQKNYGVRCGRTVDSEIERQRRGKSPANPPSANNAHWATDDVERKRREGRA